MAKVIREKGVEQVLGVVILALSGGASTANATGRKAEQWNNLCCDYGGALGVNLHVGGDGHAPTEVLTEKVTLLAFLKGTPTDRGKQGIMTDCYRKALKKLKAVGVGRHPRYRIRSVGWLHGCIQTCKLTLL